MDKKEIVAVAGGTGFIGQHLVSKLLKEGYQVKVLSLDNRIEPKPSVTFFRGDLTTGEGVERFLEGADVLVHLAGRVLPPEEQMIRDNAQTAFNLLNIARNSSVKKLIFSSSVAVYGEQPGHSFKESDVCHPNTVYGLSKLMAEDVCRWWGSVTGNEVTILRFFNIFGPGNRKGVIFNFLKSLQENGVVNIFGDGKQSRDYLYVDDAVEALVIAFKRGKSGIYNVGYGQVLSLLEVIEKMRESLEREFPVNFKEAEGGKVNEVLYNIEKIKQDFDWVPEIDFADGLSKTALWYNQDK